MAFWKLNSTLSREVKNVWIPTAVFGGLKEVLEFAKVQFLPRYPNSLSYGASGSLGM